MGVKAKLSVVVNVPDPTLQRLIFLWSSGRAGMIGWAFLAEMIRAVNHLNINAT